MRRSISTADINYFAGHALSGLLSNPDMTSVNGQKYLMMKNLTIEQLAMQSAMKMAELAQVAFDAMDQLDAQDKEKNAAKDAETPLNLVPGEP